MAKAVTKLESICFVDDDADNEKKFMRWASVRGVREIHFVESAFDAADIPAQVYVMDLSSLTPMRFGQHAYGPVYALYERRPSATFIIGSFLPMTSLQEILNELESELGVSIEKYNPFHLEYSLDDALARLNLRAPNYSDRR